MGAHLIDSQFQSDKYPTTPRGKVPLSVKDITAQDLLWEYAQRRRSVDPEFSSDLEQALIVAGYEAPARDEGVISPVTHQLIRRKLGILPGEDTLEEIDNVVEQLSWDES